MSGTIHTKSLQHIRDWTRGELLLANGANGGFNRTHDAVRDSQGGVNQPMQVPSVARRAPSEAVAVRTRTFQLEDATPDDWLLCKELDSSGQVIDNRELGEGGLPIGEIPIVKIAKTRELQRTWQDGEEDTLGRLHTFDESLRQTVTRNEISETWIPIPMFQIGDQIQATQVVYSGAVDGENAITLQDANPAGRAWAKD